LLPTLNIGAIGGLFVPGTVAARIGVRPATIGWFLAAAVFLALLSVKLPGIGVYVTVLPAGCFVFSAQVLVYAYVGHPYGDANGATGLGSAGGVRRIGAICGRLLSAALVPAGITYPWGFYAFAIV